MYSLIIQEFIKDIGVIVTFFEDEPLFASPTACESISQVLPIPLLVSISDQSNSSPHVELPNHPSSPLQTYHRRARLPTSDPPNIKGPSDSSLVPISSPTSDPPTMIDDFPVDLDRGTHSTQNPYPIYNFLSYHRLPPSHYAFVFVISSIPTPRSSQEALSHLVWRQSMIDEMTALESNQTWTLV